MVKRKRIVLDEKYLLCHQLAIQMNNKIWAHCIDKFMSSLSSNVYHQLCGNLCKTLSGRFNG